MKSIEQFVSVKIKKEAEKVRDDFLYFVDSFAPTIVSPTEGEVSLSLNGMQRKLHHEIFEHEGNLTTFVKLRQIGATTYFAALAVWMLMRGETFFYIGHNRDYFIKMCRDMLDGLGVEPTAATAHVVELDGAEILTGISVRAIKCVEADMYVIDEAAYVQGLEGIWEALKPYVWKWKIVVASTPNVYGIDNYFDKLVKENI